MLKIKEAVIVEGKYDKIKLSSVVDTVIITTEGFRIFKNPEKLSLIRYYAEKFAIIVKISSSTEKLRHSFFFGIVSQDYWEQLPEGVQAQRRCQPVKLFHYGFCFTIPH